ncbi:synaptonemal complex central element protein 1-like isoform X2 [Ascaphus truei]|uniref:synaptonemal complex central element protein 1-like isoform X2 n=1 Tax=Ascaphus truei TaxID=8439 RepID=UPI003F5A991E
MEASLPMNCNSENLRLLVRKLQEAGDLEPKLEDLINKIKKLQQAKHVMGEELQAYRRQSHAAQRELDELNAEKLCLEEMLNKKQETLQMLQLQCDKKGAENQRQQQLSQECTQRMEDITSKIQEEKLKQRKQRMEFEKQLEELTEKHKGLWEFHNEKRLASQITEMGERKQHLLDEERQTQGKLAQVLEDVSSLRGPRAAHTAESSFLRSTEAACAVSLFEEENARAEALLEASSKHHSQLHEEYMRMRKEQGPAAGNLPEPLDASSGKTHGVKETTDQLPAISREEERPPSRET